MIKKIIVHNPNHLPTTSYKNLKDLQGNLKTLSSENLEKLKQSILKHGIFIPKFVWIENSKNYWIEDGHQTIKALASLEKEGYTIPDVPYVKVECDNKKDAAEKLLQINSRYGIINPETTFFEDFDIDLDFINEIEIPELDIILDELEPEIVEDEVPEPPAEPLSKTGDLWLCGRQRVLCGDATKAEDIERLMDGKKADMVFTDPPYGVSYSEKNTFLNAIDKGNRLQDKIEGDAYQQDNTEEIWLSAFQNIKATLADDASFYICSVQGGESQMMMMMMMKKAELDFHHMLVWVKNNHVLGRSDYNYKHEPIIYGWNKKHTFYGKGDQKTSVWQYDKPHKSDLHPVMKPVGLVANALLNSSKKGDICIDFFLGSGTTIIACEQLNRICYGCEISEAYCDVILDRFVNLTGINPIREDGVKWSELKRAEVQ